MYELKKMFPKLILENDESNEFFNYVHLKGVYLYKKIYDVILLTDDVVRYKEISNIIRYDKYIRNVLYKYLSALEEQWRSLVFDLLEYNDTIKNAIELKFELSKVHEKATYEQSTFYYLTYNRHFTLRRLIDVMKKFEVILGLKFKHNDYESILELRNKVMHHNLLLLSHYENIDRIEQNIETIERFIEGLWLMLDANFKEEFTKAINNGNYKGGMINQPSNLKRFCLGVFKNGVFDKKANEKE